MNRHYMFSLVCASLFLSSLSDSPFAAQSGSGSDQLQINATIQRSHTKSIQYSFENDDVKGWVTVKLGNTDVVDAVVKIGDKKLTYDAAFMKQYSANFLPSDYQPGSPISVSVTVGGKTYAGTVTLPGGITISGNGTGVSWAHEGTGDWLSVSPADNPGNPTYDTYQGIGTTKSTNLNSPQKIPSSAYTPAGKIFLLHVVVSTWQNAFNKDGATGSITVNDISSVEFQK